MSQISFTPSGTRGMDPLNQTDSAATAGTTRSTSYTAPGVTSDTTEASGVSLDIPVLPLPQLGALSLEQLVEAVGGEGRRLAVQHGLEAITAKGAEIQELNDKKMEEIQKQLEQLQKKEKLNPWIKAFKVIGMVLGAVAAVAGVALGAATGNPLLIAGGCIGLVMLANSISSEVSGGKYSIGAGVGAIAKSLGASEEAAKWIGFAVEMAITLAGVALSIGGVVKVTKVAADVAEATGETLSTLMKWSLVTTTASSILGGANTAAQGGVQIASSVYDYKIAQAKAEMQDLQAILERVQTAMQTEEDFVESVMQRVEELLGTVKSIVQDNITAQTAILAGSAPSMA